MADPKIERCVCGLSGELLANRDLLVLGYFVTCKYGGCWRGPQRESKEEAAGAWNRVMLAAKEADDE